MESFISISAVLLSMARKIADETIQLMQELRGEGLSVAKIAQKTKVSYTTAYVYTVAKQRGFASINEYHTQLAKEKGFASINEYEKHLAKQRGFASINEYHTQLAKEKGF